MKWRDDSPARRAGKLDLFPWICLLCALPVLVPAYPAMVDLPQHAAQIEAIKGVLSGDWKYAHLFEITYLTPYWIGYAVALLLSIPFGAVWACKIAVSLALVSFPLAARSFCRRMGVDGSLCWLLIPLPFGFAYEWGFLNFLMAAPIGFLLLNSVLSRNEGRYWWLRVALWVHLLFFAHILTAAFFCAISVFLLSRPWNGFWRWMRNCLPLFSVFPALFAYVFSTLVHANKVSDPIFWDQGVHRAAGLLGAFSPFPTDTMSWMVSCLALAAPLLLGYRPRRDPIYFIPFLVFAVWMLFGPHHVLGNSYTYHRFDFFGLPLYLICFDYTHKRGLLARRVDALLRASFVLVAVLAVSVQFLRSMAFEREYEDYRNVIANVEPGRRMLLFPVDRYSNYSRAPVYLHFPSWYQAETRGLVDFSFASMYVIIQYKEKAKHPIQPGFEWAPLSFNWVREKGGMYDYYLFRSRLNPTGWMEQQSDCGVVLVARTGVWWLFARAAPGSHCAAGVDRSPGK